MMKRRGVARALAVAVGLSAGLTAAGPVWAQSERTGGAPAAGEGAAQAASQAAAPSGADVVVGSGMDSWLTALQPQIALGAGQGMPPQVAEAAAAAFEPTALIARAAQEMEAGLAPEDRRAAIDFYESPLGVRVLAAERAAAGPEAQMEVMRNAQGLLAQLEGAPERKAVYERIIAHTNLNEISRAGVRAIAISTLDGALTAQQGGVRPERAQILQLLEQQLAPAMAAMEPLNLAAFAQAYREVSVEDLTAYAAWTETPEGERFYAASLATLLLVLEDAAEDFGARVAVETKEL